MLRSNKWDTRSQPAAVMVTGMAVDEACSLAAAVHRKVARETDAAGGSFHTSSSLCRTVLH